LRINFSYPSQTQLDQFLNKLQQMPFSYTEIGQTQNETDSILTNYTIDYNFICLGKGDEVWKRANIALSQWKHFPPSFTKIYPHKTAIAKGNIVVVMIKILGLWWRNSAKIVYIINESNRFGFAYGTLTEHAEQGEEAFWISRDSTDKITYHIKAFSKPRHWAAKLFYPITRKYQHKFAAESLQTMVNICAT